MFTRSHIFRGLFLSDAGDGSIWLCIYTPNNILSVRITAQYLFLSLSLSLSLCVCVCVRVCYHSGQVNVACMCICEIFSLEVTHRPCISGVTSAKVKQTTHSPVHFIAPPLRTFLHKGSTPSIPPVPSGYMHPLCNIYLFPISNIKHGMYTYRLIIYTIGIGGGGAA